MLFGTETLLEYVLDINLINKPENLKFYYDSNRTQEIMVSKITDQNSRFTRKGFMQFDDFDEIRLETIYWEWPMETGNNDDEISKNDELDSTWMGNIMSMDISATGMQVKEPIKDMYVTDGVVARYEALYNTNQGHSNNTEIWYDISGNNNNGIVNNASSNWHNNYLEFDGKSSWVNLGEMNSDNQTIEVTFSSNIDISSVTYIIGNWQDGGGGIALRNTGYIYGEFWFNSLRGYSGVYAKEKITKDKIYNVSITYNGLLEIMYINGVEIGRKERNEPIQSPLRSTVMAIGVNPDGNSAKSGYFNGKIYSAAIYNRGLTAEEVKQNAQTALTFAYSK